MKIKYNMITWLYIIMLYPVSAFLVVFMFNTLAVVFGENQTYDMTVMLILLLQLLIFILFYFIFNLLYTNYMVIDEHEIKIYFKANLDNTIYYERITSIDYTRFRFSSIFTFVWDDTNTVTINYINKDGVAQQFKAKICKYEYRMLKMALKENNNIR
jgi:hypothetical protein